MAPDYGERTLPLPGDAQLEASLLQEISSLREGGDGRFSLEFYDIRVAERAAKQALNPAPPFPPPGLASSPTPSGELAGELAVKLPDRPPPVAAADIAGKPPDRPAPPHCLFGAAPATFAKVNTLVRLQVWTGDCWITEVHVVPPRPQEHHVVATPPCAEQPSDEAQLGAVFRGLRDFAAKPTYRQDVYLSEAIKWADLAKGKETRTTLRLRGISPELCEHGSFQRVLEAANLAQMVDCVRIFPSKKLDVDNCVRARKRVGTALVNAVNSSAAMSVAKYFHGRQYGNLAPIAVSFAAVQGAVEVEKAYPKMPIAELSCLQTNPFKADRARIECSKSLPGSSEASTEAGDDWQFNAHDRDAGIEAAPKQHIRDFGTFHNCLGDVNR
jgi:hypothetical protein